MLFKEYIRGRDIEKIYLRITRGGIGFEAKFTGLGQGSGCHETTTVVQEFFSFFQFQYEYPSIEDVGLILPKRQSHLFLIVDNIFQYPVAL